MTPSNPTSGDPTATPAPPSTDPAELREEIQRTRDELGGTVEALARKADVKARARDTAASARRRAKERATAVTQTVAGKGARLKEQLAGATTQAASRVGGTPGEAPPDRATGPGLPVRAIQTARQGRLPLLAGVLAVLLVGWLVWRRRRS